MPESGAPFRGSGPLRELLASLPAAMAYVAGPDLVFEFVSDGYRQVLGGRDVIGRPFREALPEIARGPRLEALHQVLETGEPRLARGEEAWVRWPALSQGHGTSTRFTSRCTTRPAGSPAC